MVPEAAAVVTVVLVESVGVVAPVVTTDGSVVAVSTAGSSTAVCNVP